MRRNLFVERCQAAGAAYLLAPRKTTDPLVNLGTAEVANATLKNGAVLGKPGVVSYGAAAQLDGTNDYIDTGYKPFTSGSARTFCGFGRRDVAGNHDALFSSLGAAGPILYLIEGGGIGFAANNFVGDFDEWAGVAPRAGEVFSYVLIFDDAANAVTLVLNGEVLSTLTHTATYPANQTLVIGQEAWAAFDGSLLPFAVFERALSTAEAQALTAPVPAARVTNEPIDDRLFVKLSHTNGRTSRWAADSSRADGIPRGIKFGNSAPGGHRDCGLALLRDPRRDWPDLNLVDDIKIYGRTKPMGRNAFEGQTDDFAGELGEGFGIGVNAVGNQVLLSENENFKALYVDLGFDRWDEAPLKRRELVAAALRAQNRIPVSTTNGGLVWDVPVEALAALERTEVIYRAPAGTKVASVGYKGNRKGAWGNFDPARLQAINEVEVPEEETVELTLDETPRVATFATPRTLAMLRALVTIAHTPAAGVQQAYSRLAVYGDHGLTRREIEGELPGVYAHDAIAHMLSAGAPDLQYTVGANGTIIPNTSFVVPNLSFLGKQTVKDAIEHTNAYFLNNYAVWDDKKFYWQPWDPSRLTWNASIEGGAHWTPTSRKAETLLNGLVVFFTDAAGVERTAGPIGSGCNYESALLQDADPNNPYTRRGRRRWGGIDVGFPLPYSSTAIQLGYASLAERKMPSRSGTLVIRPRAKGHVPSLRHPTMGRLPIWAARSFDYMNLVDWPEPEPFRVIEADYDDESKTLTAQLDTANSRMSGIMERVGIRSTGII